jgi:enoyl-CoA hydratase/carnithine racemase
MTTEILSIVRNHIGHVTLNRPEALNALSMNMIRALHRQLDAWTRDPGVHAVMVRGAGGKAFCAGGDIRALHDSFVAGEIEHILFFTEEYALDYAIHLYPKPCIALLDGVVMGGGMGISQGAAFRIATDATRIAMPETGIGFFPDVGASYFLSRLAGKLGAYLGITGAHIRAADALYSGLANWHAPSEDVADLDAALDHLAWSMDHRGDLHRVLETLGRTSLPDAPLSHVRAAIDRHFAHDSVASIVASLESETAPHLVQWARETLSVLAKRSPTMMCVTLEQLRRGADMTLGECLRMELGMVRESFVQRDFVEGIRAMIIDKDNQPRWNPPTLAEVSRESVEGFFAPHWTPEEHTLRALA